MWGIVRQWNYRSNKCGLRMLDYDNLLYPQYKDKFKSISISNDTLETVRKEAANKILEHEKAVDDWKVAHSKWKSDMDKFKVDVVEWQKQHSEYPTYEENPKFYEHIGSGTCKEWDEERKKEESGFMFAPMEPYEPTIHPDVIKHWKSIVDGEIPFGLKVSED